jgi:outer membrane receptor protein involved in Fe transport
MTTPSPRSPRRLLRAAACALALLAPSAALAAAPAPKTFDLPADAAETSLKRFAAQAGTEVLFTTEAVARVRTAPVKGTLAPAEALARMLAGTVLVARLDEASGLYLVRRSEPAESPNAPAAPRAEPAPARTAASAARSPAAADDSAIVLSPFVVQTAKDTGYQASDSLAGTRLRTPLRDIAASVSVVTKDFLDDTGATNAAELLVYTTGTEVAGVGGNFSGSNQDNGFQNFHGARQGVNPTNRVRGLAGADLTRNYFGSGFPMDAYNTESVTINRGANAILFGLGSPAGIIETTTIMPQFRNRGTVEGRLGSYASHRQSLDVERVLLPGKVSLRVAALNDAQNFEQRPAVRDQRRLYAAIEARPLKGLTLRANAEQGRLFQRLPHLDPPVDAVSTWFQFGKPDRVDNLFNVPATRPALETATGRNGPPGQWFAQPGILFYGPGATTPSDAFPTFADGRVGNQTIQYRFLAPRDSRNVATVIPPINPLGQFFVANQILDRSAFDYRRQMIEGPNSELLNRFENRNLAIEQIFLGGLAGLEFVHDRNRGRLERFDLTQGVQSYEITVDINRQTNDGRPNPNFGRPFFAGVPTSALAQSEGLTNRLTGFLKWDFEDTGFGPRWLRTALGRHSVTGFYSDGLGESFNISGPGAVIAPTWRNSVGATDIGARQIPTVVYLGPSLANATGLPGAGLSGIASTKRLPDRIDVWTIVQGTNTWVRQQHAVHQFPDVQWTANNVTASRSEVESFGGVWQGTWAGGLLVSTVGWRRDAVDVFNGHNNDRFDPATGARPISRPAVTPSLAAENDLVAGGLALHVPARWTARLPGRPRVSLYHNDSENFQVTGFRQSVLGKVFDPQSGTSKEYGLGLALFDGKLTLRATRYKTIQDNITDSRLGSVLSQVAQLEERIVENNTLAAIRASGYVGIDHPNASPLFRQYLDRYNFRIGAANADGTRAADFTTLTGQAEITSAVSEGYEFEAICNPRPNWRILVNAARQEAVRGPIGTDLDRILRDRAPEYAKPAVQSLAGGPIVTQTVATWVSQNIDIPYRRTQLSVGQTTPELRKWRVNAVTNYDFTRDTFGGRLRGWSIGGAARWQDKEAIGFTVINHPTLGLVEDPTQPFFGSPDLALDTWIGYRRKIFRDRIDWRVQLNVKNVLNENRLIPVKANPVAVGDARNFTIGAYRIGEERTWELSSRFSF